MSNWESPIKRTTVSNYDYIQHKDWEPVRKMSFFLPNVRNIFHRRLRSRFFTCTTVPFFTVSKYVNVFLCYGKSNALTPIFFYTLFTRVPACMQMFRTVWVSPHGTVTENDGPKLDVELWATLKRMTVTNLRSSKTDIFFPLGAKIYIFFSSRRS